MHADISYHGTQAEKDRQALEDIEGWLSKQKFCKVTNEFVATALHNGLSRNQLAFLASFGGVAGYPVSAWLREVARLTHKHTND